MSLGSNLIRWSWRIQRKLVAITFVLIKGVDGDPMPEPNMGVLETLLNYELDRLRATGLISKELERYIEGNDPPD